MMQWQESVSLALWALALDKVKAFLTMLGIMIGSASIVLVVTIGSSGKNYVISQVQGIGSNLAFATLDRNGAPTVPDDEITPEDLKTLRYASLAIVAAAGTYDIPADFHMHGRTVHASLVGVTEEFQAIRNLTITSGRYFDAEDFVSRSKICLITQKIASGVFGPDPAVGNVIQLAQFRCTIVGTFREGVPTFGQSEIQEYTVLVPFPLVRTITGDNFLQVIYAQATTVADVPEVTRTIDRLLRSRHRKAARYSVQNLSSVLRAVGNISNAMTWVLIAVAFLTLITAGSGIMNIMFVNVSQRKYEIGIRKAVGARPAEIRLQFLMEAVFISVAGAVAGILIAVALVVSASNLAESPTPLTVSWIAVVVALVLTTGVGIIFGYRPASVAARLSPIIALRTD
ncbi:MAG TPA: ABC transporter permease [Alphaproteobacteria bacterium]|nr:ABC transporter permease [Alphaproteobacteria bacterium]